MNKEAMQAGNEAMPEISNRRFEREQEGFARPLSVPEGTVLTCSSFFTAHSFSLKDFRGSVTPLGVPIAPHKDRHFVEWETTPAQAKVTTIFTWIGGSQVRPLRPAYPRMAATLIIDGESRLQFPLATIGTEWFVANGGITLGFKARRFQSLVEMPMRWFGIDGISGFYHLQVPAEYLTVGRPLRLRVELAPPREGVETFYYVSPRTDALKVDLAILRDEVVQLQTDLVQLKISHEMLYSQVYPQLFPQRIQGQSVIAHQDETKHLHPANVTVLADGEIVISVREATDHLGLDGRMIAVRSHDNGKTWSRKEVLFDLGNCDHRTAPIFELPNGDWVTTDYRAAGEYTTEGVWDVYACVHGPTLWAAWSTDRGKTWSFADEPMTVPGALYPYAEVERHMIRLPSGRLLVAANYTEAGPDGAMPDFESGYRIAVSHSDDDGRSWQVLSHLPRHPFTVGEATMLRTLSGRILLLSRTQDEGEGWIEKGGLLQSVSHDDGQSWSEWEQTGMSSMNSPGHLLQLQDGRILCSHASRTYPGSIYVTLSHDEGKSWDTAHTRLITNDITNFDTCYPNSGQMADGTIITVWYANLFGKYFVPALIYRAEQL